MILDYGKYLYRKARKKKPNSISRGNISIFHCQEGFKLFFKERELSKNVGFGCSWLDDKNCFSDISKFESKLLNWQTYKLSVKRVFNHANVEISFIINKNNKINCVIQGEFQTPVKRPKVTLMLQSSYKKWLAGIYEGSFPQTQAWYNIGLPDNNPEFIGTRTDDILKYPILIFSFAKAKHQIENTDKKINSRVLAATYENMHTSKFYLEGCIELFSDLDKYHNFLATKRTEFLKL